MLSPDALVKIQGDARLKAVWAREIALASTPLQEQPMCDGNNECFRLAAQLTVAEALRDHLIVERDRYRLAAATMHNGLVGHMMAGAFNAKLANEGVRLFDEAEAARGIGFPEDVAEITSYKTQLEAAIAERDALRGALFERVEGEHDDATHWPAGSERDGHKGEFAECPHADCRLVQGLPSPPPR